MAKLSVLEKSHLVSLAIGEPRMVRTVEDLRALNRLVKFSFATVTEYDEAEGDPDGWTVTEKGKEFCRDAKNIFTKAQIALLRSRIARGKYWVPKVGQLVYTDTRLSIDHGWDDVQGGMSLVTKVGTEMSGGDPDCVFIEIAQHGRSSNWTQFLFPDQKELMERFKNQVAYPDPDYR